MVLEPKVLSSNLDSVIQHFFNYIPRVEHHLLEYSLNPHVRGNVEIFD
jgi:hypothetical protein